MLIETFNPETFIVYKDEPNTKGIMGVPQNKIIEVPNFVTAEAAKVMIEYFEKQAEKWGPIAFFGSRGMGLAPNDPTLTDMGLYPTFFADLKNKFQEGVETIYGYQVRPNTSHAQKWEVGGFAAPHSDNSDNEGNPNPFEINKLVGILYLNDDYEGGELYFPDHDIEFRPQALSWIVFPGGIENIHGVKEITKGTRYTMVSFWDFADAEYDEERKAWWEAETAKIRDEQKTQQEEWAKEGQK